MHRPEHFTAYVNNAVPETWLHDVRLRAVLILSALALATAAWTFDKTWLAYILFVVGAITAISSLYDWRTYPRAQIAKYQVSGMNRTAHVADLKTLKRGNDEIKFEQLKVDPTEQRNGFTISSHQDFSSDAFLRSPAFDNNLTLLPILPFSESKSRCHTFLPADRRQAQLSFLATKMETKSLTNDTKFGLSGVLGKTFLNAQVYKIGYFDSLVTNEAFRNQIYTRVERLGEHDKPKPHTRLDEFFPIYPSGGAWYLKPFPTPDIANHVGITTLALTADNEVVLHRQAAGMAIGEGQVVVSGSGSVDYADLERSDHNGDLLKVIRYSMARELSEEASRVGKGFEVKWLKKKNHATRISEALTGTIITGFFRWVNRCGKPEFIGVTKLNEISGDITPDEFEVTAFKHSLPRVHKMRDFPGVLDYVRTVMAEENTKVVLSSYVCLLRLCEISSFVTSTDEVELAVYTRVRDLLQIGD